VDMQEPVYGSTDTQFSDFLAPAMIALITFAHSIGITAIAFVRERLESTMDRIFAAGVSSATIIAAHFVTHSLISLVQNTLLLGTVLLFHVPIEGSIPLVFFLLLIMGWTGMSFGLLISSVAEQERDATQMSLASFFPALLMSGVMWPAEAIPNYLSWFSISLPTTNTANAMRSVMIRGWDPSHKAVWLAFVVCAAWAFTLLSIASWRLKSVDKQGPLKRARSMRALEKFRREQAASAQHAVQGGVPTPRGN